MPWRSRRSSCRSAATARKWSSITAPRSKSPRRWKTWRAGAKTARAAAKRVRRLAVRKATMPRRPARRSAAGDREDDIIGFLPTVLLFSGCLDFARRLGYIIKASMDAVPEFGRPHRSIGSEGANLRIRLVHRIAMKEMCHVLAVRAHWLPSRSTVHRAASALTVLPPPDAGQPSLARHRRHADATEHGVAASCAGYSPYPSDVIDPTHTLFVPRSLVFRLSKWCDHAGSGETDARKFTRALFRHGNELGAIPRRFVDQGDHPIPPRPSTVALSDFERWADSILAAWGGIPNKPHAVSAALGAW